MGICIALMVVGLSVFTIGIVKSIKSKFTNLAALIWIWLGVSLLNIELVIAWKLL